MLSYLDIILIGIKEPTRVAESLNCKERFPMYSLFDSNFISIMDLIFKSILNETCVKRADAFRLL